MTHDSPPPAQGSDIGKILRGAAPEIRDLLRRAYEQGYVVAAISRRNHFSIATPPGYRPKAVIHAAKTPSDYRGVKNLRAKLRRIGVKIPHQGH